MCGEPEGRKHYAAKEDRWRVIRPEEADELLGKVAIRKPGISVRLFCLDLIRGRHAPKERGQDIDVVETNGLAQLD